MPGTSPAPYYGSHVYNCRAQSYEWSNTSVVIVSGWGPNFCGHAMLKVGNDYFHIDGKFYEFPWHLNTPGFLRYLNVNGKRQRRSDRVRVSDPARAQAKLEELTARKWFWGAVAHNCATFVEEIIQAGGSTAGVYSNCPAQEAFK